MVRFRLPLSSTPSIRIFNLMDALLREGHQGLEVWLGIWLQECYNAFDAVICRWWACQMVLKRDLYGDYLAPTWTLNRE
jgi:hypothetical protein